MRAIGYMYVYRKKHDGGISCYLERAKGPAKDLAVVGTDLDVPTLERVLKDLKAIEAGGIVDLDALNEKKG